MFSGQLDFTNVNFSREIEKEFQKFKVKPDEVVFIYPGYLDSIYKEEVEKKTSLYSSLTRFESIPVTALSFDQFADFTASPIYGESKVLCDLNSLRDGIIRTGVIKLASDKKDQVILKAPSGTAFVKPSKQVFDEFISTASLTVGYSEHQFLAFCILSKKPKMEVNAIYIDTSSISGVIEAVVYYLYKFSGENCKNVKYHSFSSYDGKHLKPDSVLNAWIIISASRSNNLGVSIAKEWGLLNEQVLTILSYKKTEEDKLGDEILVDVSGLSDSCLKEQDSGSLVKVAVVGENFTSELKSPYAVMIKGTHKPKSVSGLIEKNNTNKLFICNKNHVALTANVSELYGDKFIEWLDKIIGWYLPVNLKWVITSNDEGADLLFNKLKESLNKVGVKDYKRVNASDIEKEVNGEGAAIVLSPLLMNGDDLLRINRSLRIAEHKGNRIFISALSLFESKEEFSKCKNSVLYGPNSLKYLFYTYHEAFSGGGLSEQSSWELEEKVVGELPGEFWRSRLGKLHNQDEGLKGFIGIHSFDSNKRLEFTKDFAFWSGDYDENQVDPEAVYATVSAILQNLRDKKLTDIDKDSLFSYVYHHSVIDPYNFERFNDSLLQSSLWRGGKARELDYSTSDDMSAKFCSIVEDLFVANKAYKENASVDLLMGIAVGRIKVTQGSLRNLVDLIKKLSSLEHVKVLVDYIKREQLGDDGEFEDDIPF
ncbi:hypothetical protein [Neptuniibacter sp.]|uniref:hypothetical protein n=1 Tax=Neptuniibacter sp. TaxID=1962643 RepID=UPI003B5ADA3E